MASIITRDHSAKRLSAASGFASSRTHEDPLCIETVSLNDLLSLPCQGSDQKHPHKDVLCVGRIAYPSRFRFGAHFKCAAKQQTANLSIAASMSVYIKRQWAWDRSLPRWSDWRDGVSGVPDPVREHDGLQRMQSAGLNVPTPLRLLRDSKRRSPRAALIMTAVPVERSLAEWLRQGEVGRLSLLARRGLVTAIAEMSDQLIRHGLRWRSMKAKHIYPESLANDQWRLWLIDCEGVRTQATRRQQRRDRELFLSSLRTAGADAAFCSAVESVLFRRHVRPL